MRQDINTNIEEGAREKKTIEKRPKPRTTVKSESAPAPAPAKKKMGGKAAGILVLVVLIGLLGAGYYYNLLDLKTKVIAFFISQDDQYTQAMEKQSEESEQLNLQQAELNDQTGEIERRTAELDEREAAVDYREKQAAGLLEDEDAKRESLAKMAKIYEGMDSATAAGILGNLIDREWIANLLAQMSEKKAAAILSSMDAALAADISMRMVSG